MNDLQINIASVTFLTNSAFQIAGLIQALWTFHFTIAIAALGWAMTSRSWSRGLHPLICVCATVSLAAIFALNLLSLYNLYVRQDLALAAAARLWSDHGGLLDQVLGSGPPKFLVAVAALDFVAAVLVGLLLSPVGRRQSEES